MSTNIIMYTTYSNWIQYVQSVDNYLKNIFQVPILSFSLLKFY